MNYLNSTRLSEAWLKAWSLSKSSSCICLCSIMAMVVDFWSVGSEFKSHRNFDFWNIFCSISSWIRSIPWLEIGKCHGMTESAKVHRKDQLVKDFTSKCLFLLFWSISGISLIFLIEIWSFCTNLLENYPVHKIDQLPLLRILSLCMDHSMQTRINSLYLFLLFLFTPLALFGQNDVSIDPYNCFSLTIVLDQA